MPLTPSGNATSYLSPTDFLTYYCDPRWVADRLKFDGTRAGAIPNSNGGAVNVATVAALPIVQKNLNRASGQLEAACLRGGRYQAADLLALNGTVGQDFRDGIIAGLAKGHFMEILPAAMPLLTETLQSLDWLEQLASGERIFAFAEAQDAGLPSDETDTPETVYRRRGVVTSARRYFGRRNNQEWPGGRCNRRGY